MALASVQKVSDAF